MIPAGIAAANLGRIGAGRCLARCGGEDGADKRAPLVSGEARGAAERGERAGLRGWLAGPAGRRTGRASWARVLGEKRWRERGPRGQAGPKAGPRVSEGGLGRGVRLVGPSAGKGEGVGLGPVVGFLGRVSVGFGFVFYFLFFSIPKLHPN